jgi:hypothetical protein
MSSSPFGNYGPILASATAAAVVAAALAVHLAHIVVGGAPQGDPFLDNAGLLVLGVVLGVGAIGGTATRAEASAQAANVRLDQAGVPPAQDAPNGGGQAHG